MTPERKAYLGKCSIKERTLRALITDEKCAIKVLKNNFKYPENYNRNILLIMVRQCKVRLAAYKRALNHYFWKGASPIADGNDYEADTLLCPRCFWGVWHEGQTYKVDNYCPQCGIKLDWTGW